MGNHLVMILACVNIIVAAAYAYDGQLAKMWYWLAASQINWAITLMK